MSKFQRDAVQDLVAANRISQTILRSWNNGRVKDGNGAVILVQNVHDTLSCAVLGLPRDDRLWAEIGDSTLSSGSGDGDQPEAPSGQGQLHGSGLSGEKDHQKPSVKGKEHIKACAKR